MMNNSGTLADLYKDQTRQFGLDLIINVPTAGTGAVEAESRVVVVVEYCNMDLSDTINILTKPHKLTLDQVRSYFAWFMGDETSSLTIPHTPADMIIKVIDPNTKRATMALLTVARSSSASPQAC